MQSSVDRPRGAFLLSAFAAVLLVGLAGVLAFGALIGGALARSAAPLRLRVALALSWLLLGLAALVFASLKKRAAPHRA